MSDHIDYERVVEAAKKFMRNCKFSGELDARPRVTHVVWESNDCKICKGTGKITLFTSVSDCECVRSRDGHHDPRR